MKVWYIFADGKKIGFTFNYSTVIQKDRELRCEGKKVDVKEEDIK